MHTPVMSGLKSTPGSQIQITQNQSKTHAVDFHTACGSWRKLSNSGSINTQKNHIYRAFNRRLRFFFLAPKTRGKIIKWSRVIYCRLFCYLKPAFPLCKRCVHNRVLVPPSIKLEKVNSSARCLLTEFDLRWRTIFLFLSKTSLQNVDQRFCLAKLKKFKNHLSKNHH